MHQVGATGTKTDRQIDRCYVINHKYHGTVSFLKTWQSFSYKQAPRLCGTRSFIVVFRGTDQRGLSCAR
jgi:hypothetical protein